MVDYTKSTGSAGTLLIRDLGYQIQFHLRSADSATWTGTPGFKWTGNVNGVEVEGRVANYSNTEWRHVASYDVGSSQTVRFSIEATGTSGFGGPTDFYQYIDRATVPGKPTNLRASDITTQDVRVDFDLPGDGGAAISGAHAEWKRVRDGVVVWDDAGFGAGPAGNPVGGTTRPGGVGFLLEPGTEYDVKVRMLNEKGWGEFSDTLRVRTLAAAFVKVGGQYKRARIFVKVGGQYKEHLARVKVGGQYKTTV